MGRARSQVHHCIWSGKEAPQVRVTRATPYTPRVTNKPTGLLAGLMTVE